MKRRLFKVLFGICLLSLLGARWVQYQAQWHDQLALFPQPAKGSFKVQIAEEPEVFFDHSPGGHEMGQKDGFYEGSVKEVRAVCRLISQNGQTLPPVLVRCTFRLSPVVSRPVLNDGDRIRFEAKVERPSTAMNPGQFDYAQYLKTKGVPYVAYVPPGRWEKETGPRGGFFLGRWAADLKRWAEEEIDRVLPYPENALLNGILLGERSDLPEDIVESFFVTGTIHILAVSGMITAFVAGLFFMIFRALWLGRKGAAFLSILAVGFFILLTGTHPPVCRAGLFSILALTAVLFERRVRGGPLLLSTAYLLLFIHPFVLEDLSFQISFLATAGLMVMAPWMMERFSFLPEPIAWLITASLAAQLSVWCLILYDFNQFSVYSVLSNVLIVPLALFATAGGLALLTGACFHPFFGALFGAGCYGPLKLLSFLSGWMGHWPGAQFIVASPPFLWVLLFHLFLLALFYFEWPRLKPEAPSDLWKKERALLLKGRRWAWALTGCFLLVSLGFFGWRVLRPQPLRVSFLAVGHGNAVVLRSPQGRTFLVDAGKDSPGPDRYQMVVAYLRHEGVRQVDGLLNTHPDEDHVGGLVNVLRAYPVGIAYEGVSAHSDSSVYSLYEATLARKGVKDLRVGQGEALPGLEPAQWALVHPAFGFHPKLHEDNNRSVVSLITYGGFKLLLPGDLEKPGLLELLRNNPGLKPLDWLMAPHHGRNSGEPMLCERGFEPGFVVLSDYRDYPDARDQYQSGGAQVLSTALDGAIEVELNADGTGRYHSYRDPRWKNLKALSSFGLQLF